MASFQNSVVFIALILFFGFLLITTIFITQSKAKEVWPPTLPQCPDYWVAIDSSQSGNVSYLANTGGNGKTGVCLNVQDLGTCEPDSNSSHLMMDFTKAPYIGANGNCAKYKWAKKCGLSWDGITYGVNQPPCMPSMGSLLSGKNACSNSIF